MNSTTTTLDVGRAPGLLSRRSAYDWLFALAVIVGAGYAFSRYGAAMDVYEKAILVGAVPSSGWTR